MRNVRIPGFGSVITTTNADQSAVVIAIAPSGARLPSITFEAAPEHAAEVAAAILSMARALMDDAQPLEEAHLPATLIGGVVPAHAPGAYPTLSCCGGPLPLDPLPIHDPGARIPIPARRGGIDQYQAEGR